MSKNFIITTDNTSDLPREFVEKHNLPLLHIDYIVDDVLYDGINRSLSIEEFYDKMRGGAMPSTQQANPASSAAFFREFLSQGLDVLHIAFSSGLSGTFNSNCLGADELREEFPERKLLVVDSLCASMGEGLLIAQLLKLQKEGRSIEELAEWVEQNRLKLVHDVVADDLNHLHRGGRVSKTAAIMGTALGIKPMIYLDKEGKLTPYGKMRGKKAALTAMANRLASHIDPAACDMIFISHSDCIEDAKALEAMVRERKVGVDNFQISYVGPTIGSHTGIGTVAIFYFSDDRDVTK